MAYYFKGSSTFTIPNPKNASFRIYYRKRDRYATKPVAKEPAPYKLQLFQTTSTPYESWMDCPNTALNYELATPTSGKINMAGMQSRATDRALSKFKDKLLGEQSQLAAPWGERKQSVDMIADRAAQMRQAWRSLRRGDFRSFKRHLHLPIFRGDNRWSRPTDAAKIWLEYWFGWKPLVGDIYNAIDVLQREGPALQVQGRGTVRSEYVYTPRSGNWNWHYNWPLVTVRSLVQARVRVSNPNLYRANQLGLVNPASVAWELIPFSFLVDWFIPVGEFLDSWTTYCGLTLEQPFTTQSRRGYGTQYVRNWSWPPPIQQYEGSKGVVIQRTLGLPTKSWPTPKAFKGFSVVRGATAISLLITILKPGRDLPQPRNRS